MVELKPCPFCGEQPKQSSCMAPELVRCVNDERPHCPASFGGVSVETWNRRQPQSAEWVPWKPGDALPPDGMYVVDTDGADFDITLARPAEFDEYGIHGYWPQPIPGPAYRPRLPDPYTDAQGKRDE